MATLWFESFALWFGLLAPGDWVNLLTGVGTLVLACVAVFQGIVASRQISLGKRQAKTAEDQAEIARDQARSAEMSAQVALEVQRESLRARADLYAPRVTVAYATPTEPYYDLQRTGMPNANGLRLLDAVSIARSEPARGRHFDYSRDKDLFIWFRGYAEIFNDGESSALVRLPSESRFVERQRLDDDPAGHQFETSHRGAPGEAIVPARGKAKFEWAAGKPLKEWVDAYDDPTLRSPAGSIWLWLTVFDPREVGVIDTLLAHFRPEPLRTVSGLDGRWEVRDYDGNPVVHSLPIKRNYRHEGATTEDLTEMYRFHDVEATKHLG